MVNWDEIQKEWETTKIKLADLAEKHEIKLGTLKSRKSREKWSRDITEKDVTETALTNPVEFLTLPRIFEAHRNDIIRRLNIEIAQSHQAGESYTEMGPRIENAMGCTKKKVILVARTEGGRVRSQADLVVEEQASKTVQLIKVWMSSLGNRIRKSHRKLYGQKADKDGYYHYGKRKSKAPRLWGVASMEIQCRCQSIYLVNGKLPEYRRGKDNMDDAYQKKLVARIDAYMEDLRLTY